MTKQEILQELKSQIEEILSKDEGKEVDVILTEESHLENNLGLDSLDRIELWLSLEAKYKIDIPEEEIKPIQTVGEILALVDKYTKIKKADIN